MIPVTNFEAFLFPLLKFYRKFTFFHNAISLNPSSVRVLVRKHRLDFFNPDVLRDLKTTLLAHTHLPQSPLRLIFSRSLTEYVNINKGLYYFYYQYFCLLFQLTQPFRITSP